MTYLGFIDNSENMQLLNKSESVLKFFTAFVYEVVKNIPQTFKRNKFAEKQYKY